MTDRELLRQALEALEEIADEVFSPYNNELGKVILALRERLAQPEQDPVAWLYRDYYNTLKLAQTEPPPPLAFPVYTTPPRREWVGLTEEEVDECYYWKGRQWTTDELVRHVEAKLKEKNA